MRVYADNAATTYPKPEAVYASMLNYMQNIGANPGRGGYSTSLEASRIVFKCRERILNFFNFEKIDNVIFTQNITESLNILIKGAVKDGWHVITSSMEHNSVLRPLQSISAIKDVAIDVVQCDKEGFFSASDVEKLIKPNTKLIILSHASNVFGGIQPLVEVGQLCKKHNIFFIIDSAQTAGVIPIDFKSLNCSALAFTGHKSLLGPQGIGGFLINDALNAETLSFIEGGTGSLSESLIQPNFLPDKFESGTLNTPGIAGLLEGINYVNSIGIDYIREKEEFLTASFMEKLSNMDSITIYGTKNPKLKTAVTAINSSKIDSSELAFLLDREYSIMTRTGLHCAPLAHKTIGTFPQGCVRFSFGPFNEIQEVNYIVDSLHNILKKV